VLGNELVHPSNHSLLREPVISPKLKGVPFSGVNFLTNFVCMMSKILQSKILGTTIIALRRPPNFWARE